MKIDYKEGNEYREYYGEGYEALKSVEATILQEIETLRKDLDNGNDQNPIEHFKSRIKSPNSMREKLIRKDMTQSLVGAFKESHDAVGVRIVCTFVKDVYMVVDYLSGINQVVQIKDYIKTPKKNGYRSLHMILRFPINPICVDGEVVDTIDAEIQLRTIAMDCWASLEHQLRYKHDIKKQDLIEGELKRCADDIASTDMNLQTIREMIKEEE